MGYTVLRIDSHIWGCERFGMYLYGQMIYTPKSKRSPRIEIWILRPLLPFTFKLHYIPTSRNVVDSLLMLIAKSTKQQDLNDKSYTTNTYWSNDRTDG